MVNELILQTFINDSSDNSTNTTNQTQLDARSRSMMEGVLQKISQKILFIPDLEKMIGRNRVTLRRWWLTGKFPRPVKLHGTTLAWHSDEIDEWIEQTILNGEKDTL